MAHKVARLIVGGVTSAALAFGLVTVFSSWLIPPLDIPWRILLGFAITVGHFALTWYVSRIPDGRRVLKIGSRKFSRFYTAWYKREGEIMVFCDDVEWLEPSDARSIVDALKGKGSRATVFLRRESSAIVGELKGSGVRVVTIPDTVQQEVKMSLRSENGSSQLIIRDSGNEKASWKGKKNVFLETSDKYMIALAEDLFRTIKPGVI